MYMYEWILLDSNSYVKIPELHVSFHKFIAWIFTVWPDQCKRTQYRQTHSVMVSKPINHAHHE